MSAVQARIHYSMHEELRLLKGIIRDYTPEEYDYQPETGDRQIKQSDYDHVDVIPVSDPNAATMSQKVVQYQAVLQLAQGAPQLYDLPLLHRQMLEVLGIKNAQKLVPMEDDTRPRDPITENQNILKGKPVKAFFYQDHQAHIAVHSMAMQDPKIQQTLAQNPNVQGMMAAMQAHIAEHFGFKYRQLIEQQLGAPLPYLEEDEDTMPEEYEVQISRLIAQASAQLLQQNMAQASQEQAQQQAQDPIIQMQQQELQIKMQDVQRKAQKDQVDAQLKGQQLQIERDRIQAQIDIEGQKAGAKTAYDKDKLDRDSEMQATQMGIDMAAERERNAMTKEANRQKSIMAARQRSSKIGNKK
jgi:hypothetical protein